MILLFAGSTIGFVLLEKDLGAAVVFVIIFFIIESGTRRKQLITQM